MQIIFRKFNEGERNTSLTYVKKNSNFNISKISRI